MSRYASTLTPPHTIRFADAHSKDGSIDNVGRTLHAKRPYDYNAEKCPDVPTFLYLEGGWNAYQVQYRTRVRRVWGSGDEQDGQYSAWSLWSDSQFSTDPGSTRPRDANLWNFANFGSSDIAHRNQPYCTLGSHPFAAEDNDLAEYDRIQYEFRVRAFRAGATADEHRHGDWAYQTLDVWFLPGAAIVTARLDDDGGIILRYSTKWTRNGGSMNFARIVKQGTSENLVKERDGFVIGGIEGALANGADNWKKIPVEALGADIDVGDVLVFSPYTFATSSGESMAGRPITLTIRSKYENEGLLVPSVTCAKDERKKTLAVRIEQADKTSQYPWNRAGAKIQWTDVDGTVDTLQADSVTFDDDMRGATATFQTPPMDVKLKVSAWVANDAHEAASKGVVAAPWPVIRSNGTCVLQNGARTAALSMDVALSSAFAANTETRFVPGRGNVARHGNGGTQTVSLGGKVVKRGIGADSENLWQATEEAWAEMKRYSHIDGILRAPGGYRRNVSVNDINVDATSENALASVTVNLTEVA